MFSVVIGQAIGDLPCPQFQHCFWSLLRDWHTNEKMSWTDVLCGRSIESCYFYFHYFLCVGSVWNFLQNPVQIWESVLTPPPPTVWNRVHFLDHTGRSEKYWTYYYELKLRYFTSFYLKQNWRQFPQSSIFTHSFTLVEYEKPTFG